jgi:16S rRNA processing protein RimM
MKDEFFYLGTLTKPFGLKGGLCAFFDTDNPENYLNLPAVFLDIDGEKIPYTIESIICRGNNQFILQFEGVGVNEARDFVGTELYLPLSDLPKLPDNRFYFHEVIGFTVTDAAKGDIGTCREFLEVSNNPIMVVDHDGTDILIPANHQFIARVDRDNKTLHINAPEGLIDVYLS